MILGRFEASVPSRELTTELGNDVARLTKLTSEPCTVDPSVVVGDIVDVTLFLVYSADIGLEVLAAELSDPAENLDWLADICVPNNVVVIEEWVIITAELDCGRSDVIEEAGEVEPKLEDCLGRVVPDETVSSDEDGEALLEDGEALLEDGEALLEDGEALLEDGEALLEDGEALLEDGEALLDDGEGAPSQTPGGNGMCIASGAFLGRKPALKGLS